MADSSSFAPQLVRVAIYCRVSTSGQEDNSSLETQEAAGRAYCAAHGYDVVDVFADVATGAVYRDRPGLTAMRELVRAGTVNVIVAHALDRLSRNQAHLAILIEEAEDHGVRPELVTEAFDNTAFGRFYRSARAFAAEVELEKISERTQRGRAARLASGKPHPGPRPPYGYQWANEDKSRLTEHPDMAPVVRRIFAEVASGGSARGVAARLTAEGVPTPTGKTFWPPVTITLILRHPVYVGEATAQRWRTERRPGTFRKNQSRRPVDEHVTLPGVAPALVTPEIAAAAAARLTANRQHATRNNRRPDDALLRSGYVCCAACGKALHVENHPARGPLYRHSREGRDRHGCTDVVIAASELDAGVWQGMRTRLLDRTIIAAELDRMQREDPTQHDLAALGRRLGNLDRRQRTLMRRLSDEDNDDIAALIRADLASLIAERTQIDLECDDLERQKAGWEAAQRNLADLDTWITTVAGNLNAADYSTQRLALDALAVSVRVWPAHHTPRWDLTMQVGVASTTSRTC
jgi:site-specific DNA recombinase